MHEKLTECPADAQQVDGSSRKVQQQRRKFKEVFADTSSRN